MRAIGRQGEGTFRVKGELESEVLGESGWIMTAGGGLSCPQWCDLLV